MLEIKNAVCGYRQREKTHIVINGLSMDIKPGEIMSILGSNGVGKTTLFRSILGSLPLISGSVLLDGREINSMKRSETAKRIAYVPQSHNPPFPFTALQIAVMGRTAHMGMFSSPSEHDLKKAYEALEMMGAEYLAQKPYTEISGGERQLVLIARAVAQEADFLIMDEPAANLDYGNQVRALERIKQLASEGRGVMFTTHNPDHVFMAASKVTVISSRDEFMSGPTDEILTVPVMNKMYGINTQILESEWPDGSKIKTTAAYMDYGDDASRRPV